MAFAVGFQQGCQEENAVAPVVAARLRRETTLSAKAIAPSVHLSSSKAGNRSWHGYGRKVGTASASQGQPGIWPTELPQIDPSDGLTPFLN